MSDANHHRHSQRTQWPFQDGRYPHAMIHLHVSKEQSSPCGRAPDLPNDPLTSHLKASVCSTSSRHGDCISGVRVAVARARSAVRIGHPYSNGVRCNDPPTAPAPLLAQPPEPARPLLSDVVIRIDPYAITYACHALPCRQALKPELVPSRRSQSRLSLWRRRTTRRWHEAWRRESRRWGSWGWGHEPRRRRPEAGWRRHKTWRRRTTGGEARGRRHAPRGGESRGREPWRRTVSRRRHTRRWATGESKRRPPWRRWHASRSGRCCCRGRCLGHRSRGVHLRRR